MGQRYRKVNPRFWTDEKIRPLDPIQKLLALYMLTGQVTQIGCYVFSPGMAAEHLGLTRDQVVKAWRRLQEALGWVWHEPTHLVYLPRWWGYNSPESPNVVKAWRSALDALPNCPVRSMAYRDAAEFTSSLGEAFVKAFGSLPKDLPYQEQEQEQEVLPGAVAGTGAGSPPTPPGEREWLDLLNRETGQAFKPVESNLRPIRQRLREGYGLEDAHAVVKSRLMHWSADPNLRQYLRPITVFGTKFDGYLAEARRNVGAPTLTPKTQGNVAAVEAAVRRVQGETHAAD